MTVLGERGIGKRRLVEEFLSSLPSEADVMVGEASEFEEDATLAAVADLLRQELGIERDTPDEDVWASRARWPPCRTARWTRWSAASIVLGVGDQEQDGRRYQAAEIRAGVHLRSWPARPGPPGGACVPGAPAPSLGCSTSSSTSSAARRIP